MENFRQLWLQDNDFSATNISNIISISVILDVLTGYLVTTSIYPLITTIVKNNTIYSKRKLAEYIFKDIGILVGGLLIGKNIIGILINYNVCLFISIIFLAISIIVMFNMSACRNIDSKQGEKYILKSKLQVIYMIYSFIGTMAMSTA